MRRSLRSSPLLAAAALLLAALPGFAQSAPQVALSPNAGNAGQSLTVTVQGLACRADLRYSFEPLGITATAVPCAVGTLAAAPAQVQLVLSPQAQAGPYTLVIQGLDMQPLRVPGAFTVRAPAPAPTPLSLSPNLGMAGQTLTASVQGLPCRADYRYSFEPAGITATALPCAPTAAAVAPASVQLVLSPQAPAGPYTLVVQGRDMRPVRVPNAFTVTAPTPGGRVQPGRDLLPAPRVDRLAPQQLAPGQTATLTLYGSGFTQGMTVDFGRDVTALSPPLMLEPRGQRAQMQVLVSPTALEGVRLADAKNTQGKGTKGPGGFRVLPAKPGVTQAAKPTVSAKPLEIEVPHGKIILDRPNREGSGEFQQVKMWDDPPMVQKDQLFTWYEDNPGIADHFVWRITDKEGKVLAEAQTPAGKPYYRVTTALLKGLPDGAKAPFFQWDPAQFSAPAALVAASTPPSQAGTAQIKKLGTVGSAQSPTQAQVDTLLASMSQGPAFGAAGAALGIQGLQLTGKAQALWQVRGYWKHPVSGEMVEVEVSPTYPLRLPDVPKGMLDCSVAAQPNAVQVECMSATKSVACVAPATVALRGTIDLTKDPYPVSVSLASLQTMQLEYTNVWISWGDGVVEPLRVDGGSAGKDGKIKLVLNGSPTNPGILHTYEYPDTYDIKIYSLPTPDKQNPATPAFLTSGGSLYGAAVQSMAGVAAPGGIATASGTVVGASFPAVMAASQAPPAAAQAGTSGATGPGAVSAANAAVQAPQGLSPNLTYAGADAYLIACFPKFRVEEPPDLTAEGPLHLLKVAVTEFPGYSGKPAKVSDCAEAFTAKATLTYYGTGYAVWVWTVDGELMPGEFKKLPPASKKAPAQYTFESPALPVPLTGKPHGVCVRVKALSEIGEIGQAFSEGFSCGSTPPKPATVTTTVMRPTGMSFADMGAQVTVAGAAASTPSAGAFQALSTPATGLGAVAVTAVQDSALPLLAQVVLQQNEGDVWSEPAGYEVVPHDPSVPCRLYFEAKGGPFTISDVTEMKQEADGTFSGRGKLHLALPSGPDGASPFFVPLAFSHLTLTGAGDGRQVTGGTLDTAPTSEAAFNGDVTGLTGKLTRVKATAGADNPFTVTFSLGLSGNAWLKPESSAMALTATGAITKEGDFYADQDAGKALVLPAAAIGQSGFILEGQELVVDWSRAEGQSPPDSACSAAGAGEGAGWVGLLVRKGTLKPYAFGAPSLGAPLPLENWAVGWGGLSGALPKKALSKSVPLGGMTLQVKDLSVDLCGSSLKARYGVDLKAVPLIEADVPGTLQVDMKANLVSDFTAPGITKEYGTLKMELLGADFNNEAGQGWRVALDSAFTFSARGKTLTTVHADGIRVKGNGEAFWKDGTTGVTLPLGGTASMGPVKLDLVKLGLKLSSKNSKPAVDFALDAKFRVSDVLAPSYSTLLYKLQANSPMNALEPDLGDIKIDASYPPSSPVITVKATLKMTDDGSGNFRFTGKSTVVLLQTGQIDADFMLGYQGGKDYWLTRVAVPLGPSGITLYAPYLSLYRLEGGLGHNIPIDSFSYATSIENLTPQIDGSYLFMAGARLGDSAGGYVYTFDGNLTVKTTGPDAGFRINIQAWLLTGDHSGQGQFQGFIQYAGSSFDAGLWGEYHILGDAVWVKAPEKSCSVHFGPDGWHIYVGQNVEGLKLQAHLLVTDCYGYFMLDSAGFRVGGSIVSKMHYGGSLWGFGAHADCTITQAAEIAVLPDPLQVKGDYWVDVSISAGIDTPVGCLCVHPTAGLHIYASALPVSVCGEAYISFGCICICPCWDFSWDCCCDCYGTTVGPICLSL